MRKIIILLMMIIVVAMIGGIVYVYTQGKAVQITDVLPQGAIGYVNVKNIQNNKEKFLASEFWQKLAQVDMEVIFTQMRMKPEERQMVASLEDGWQNVKDNPFLGKIFKNEAAVAFYPADVTNATGENIEDTNMLIEKILSKVFIVARVDRDLQVAEMFSAQFKNFGSEVSHNTFEYEGQTIHVMRINNIPYPVVYTRLQDLLVASVGEYSLQDVIDVYQKKKSSLASTDPYQKVLDKGLNSADLFSYINFGYLFKLLEQNVHSKQSTQTASLKQMKGLETIVLTGKAGDGVHLKVNMFFNPEEMDAVTRKMYLNCPQEKNNTISYIPSDVIAYQWNNCLDLGLYWQQVQDQVALYGQGESLDQDQVQQRLATFENNLGMDIEQDFLPAVGNEIGGYLKDIAITDAYPVPQLSLFIKIGDQAKMEQLINKFTQKSIVPLQMEPYGGYNIHYLGIPISGIPQPSYAYLNDYLFIAIDRPLIKASIDVHMGQKDSLEQADAYKTISKRLRDKSVNVQFVQMFELAEKLKKVLEWSNSWVIAQEQKNQAFKSGAELRLKQIAIDMSTMEREIESKKKEVMVLGDQKWSLESKGESAAVIIKQIDEVKNSIAKLEADVLASKSQQTDIEETIHGYDKHLIDPQQRPLVLRKVLFPLLDAVGTIQSLTTQATVENNSMDLDMYIH